MLDKEGGNRRERSEGRQGKGDHEDGLVGDEADSDRWIYGGTKWQGKWPRKGPGGGGELKKCTLK